MSSRASSRRKAPTRPVLQWWLRKSEPEPIQVPAQDRPAHDDELAAYIHDHFGVTLPNVQVCENHTTPWRAFADAYFARSPVTVWKASRGFGGKSFMLALLGLTEAITLGCDVNILGGSGDQSANVIRYLNRWPSDLVDNDAQTIRRFRGGNEIRALLASSKSVRGGHPARLRLDEVDEIALPIFDAVMGQPMSQKGVTKQTVMSSTHQYADGTMTEVLNRAALRNWKVYEWCWKETLEPHGWLSQAEANSKRLDVTEAMWQSEYDLQEPSPESRAINTAAVARMFKRELGVFEGRPHEYIEIEPPMVVCQICQDARPSGENNKCATCGKEMQAATYATGADWARKQDWTIIWTLRTDCKPMRLMAFERMGREPWPVMVERFDVRTARFKGAASHDETGIGDVVAGYMKTPGARGVVMVGRDRQGLLSNYISAIERDEIEAPFIKWAEKEHRLASVDDVYGSGHLPDTIAAGALAYGNRRRGVFVG